jgi:hypothetical protein
MPDDYLDRIAALLPADEFQNYVAIKDSIAAHRDELWGLEEQLIAIGRRYGVPDIDAPAAETTERVRRHAMHDTLAMIRWTRAGITPQVAGMLWSLSVAAEVFVFFLAGPRLLRHLTPAGAIALAALAAAGRWLVAAFTADLPALIITQPLHGITFALLHLACMRLLAVTVPAHLAATAQALCGTVGVGAATVLLTLASGWLYERLGASAFAIMSVLCLFALPLAAALRNAEEPAP